MKQVNEEWAQDKKHREKRLDGIKKDVGERQSEDSAPVVREWSGADPMVVIPVPGRLCHGVSAHGWKRVDMHYEFQQQEADRSDVRRHAKPRLTVDQYRQFQSGFAQPTVSAHTAEFPVVGISWYMAAKYCNWLSKEEGIPEVEWCYEIKGDEFMLKSRYLSLAGYRMPTESEMEYATRAGAVTSGYYGEMDDLLPKYAWYNKNSQEKTWPVGSLKPNDLGLFDVQGNVFTWCQESFKPYPSANGEESAEDREDGQVASEKPLAAVLRGGSFDAQASYVRSASRISNVPAFRAFDFGFRPARTFAP